MKTKKATFIIAFISTIFISASFMIAKAYEPLVRLPGLPATGDINLSQYVIGLYNFLLSIVGIVAVMMLIIGGMKYITAAGNASIIGDAKDTITNALFGLLLALLSWVIVSTINPDVLYIKDPAASFSEKFINDLSACGNYSTTTNICTCKDDVTPVAGDQEACEAACAGNCATTRPSSCIAIGQSEVPITNKDGDIVCFCVDGDSRVVVNYGPAPQAPDDAKCNDVCSNPDWAVDGLYHGVNIVLKAGKSVETTRTLTSGDAALDLIRGREYIFDLSQTFDCKYGFVHYALSFDGKPAIASTGTTLFCCETDGACPGNWGAICNAISWLWPCSNPDGLEDYSTPMEKHTFTVLGPETMWVGVSLNNGACSEFEKEFPINIIDP